MRWSTVIGKHVVLLGLLGLSGVAEARLLRAEIATLRTASATADGVVASVDWREGAAQGELTIKVQRLELPALAYVAHEVLWHCPLLRELPEHTGSGPVSRITEAVWSCKGLVRVAGQPAYPLALQVSPVGMDAALRLDTAQLSMKTQADRPGQVEFHLSRIPVAWLNAVSQTLWAEGRWTGGYVAGDVRVKSGEADTALAASLRFSDVALETPDGLVAAAGLRGRLRADFHDAGDGIRTGAVVTWQGGEWLVGGLYAQLPTTPVQAEVRAERRGKQPWRLPVLRWQDSGVLRVHGEAALTPEGELSDLDLTMALDDLASARDRYLSGFLAPAGFPDLLLTGALQSSVSVRDRALSALDVQLVGLNAIDPRQRFVLAGLEGGLRWHAGSGVRHSTLAWSRGALYGIGLGAGRFDLASHAGVISLRSPAVLPVLNGEVALDHFQWQAPEADRGTRFQLGVSMKNLDLASLSQRLGWPAFSGSVAGRIPMARFEDGVLRLDGGVVMQLFGGDVRLSALVMERPFGTAPSLSASVAIQDIDLEPLTEAFGFGSITGRLDGRIDNLRLLDWSPIAFDARLDTDSNWKGKRRISQRAVQDISSVAGSGLIAGMQAQVLKVFDDFGYARIGLGCRLRDNVCRMDGVSSAGEGYTIVQGDGLPRIQVVGFRRRVDWPTLVARLTAATEGQRPLVD